MVSVRWKLAETDAKAGRPQIPADLSGELGVATGRHGVESDSILVP
jgi:hypothetical protein